MNNWHYTLIFALGKSKNLCIIVLRVEIATMQLPKVIAISARNTIWKICTLCKAIFSIHYNILQTNFGNLPPLIGSFRQFRFLTRPKISL